MQIAQLRVPPHSIEAESSVLGGLLLDNHAWDRVGDLLVDADFYRYEHRLIYAAIGGTGQRQQARRCDHGLRATAEPGQAGRNRAAWPISIRWRSTCPAPATSAAMPRSCASAPSCANWSAASDEIATNAFNPQGKPVDKILDEAEQKIFNIGEEGSRMKQGFQGMDTLVVRAAGPRAGDGGQPERHHGGADGFSSTWTA